jgi:fluoride exporter
MGRFFWICLGGAVGTGARYLVSGWAVALLGPGLPFGTLAVNVTGSFVLGGLMHLALTTGLIAPTLRIALTTGVLGGFTTYSTFNYETLQYLRGGAWAIGIANILLTVAACLAAGVGGAALAQWWAGA